jgi:hypothetical protein
MTRLTITITHAETASRIEELSHELGISQADIVVLAMKGRLPK